MRRFTRTRTAWTLIATTAALFASLSVPRGGAETQLDRYRSLLEEKLALQRENRYLEREADLARSPAPYIFLDVHSGTLSFRVRGKAFKEYRVKAISSRGWGRRPIAAETLWRLHDGPLTILEKEGGRQEIIPPAVDGERDELDGTTGEQEPDDAAMLGVKAPEDYYIKFEETVIFNVQSERRRSLREKAVDRLGEIATGFTSSVRDIWRDDQDDPLIIYLMIDPETAKHLYHSLLPGERIYLSPPPPPRITLAASGESP